MPVPAHQAGPAPTAKHLYASKSARTEENASRRTRASVNMGGSTRIARRPFVLLLAVMVAIARGRTRARVPRNGVEKTVAHPYVNRNARTAVGASRRTRANVPRNGTATTAVCPYVIKVNLKLMARRKRVLEYRKVILRSVWTYGRGPGPCTGLVFSKSGVMLQKASTAPSRNGRIRSWRPSPVRTIYMSLVSGTDQRDAIVSK